MNKFIGTGVAIITPFSDAFTVDVAALKNLVKDQIENGIEYIVVLGTTGESATLSSSEKELVKNTIIEANNGKLPLVLGIGGNNTAALVDEFKNTDLDAFDAILSVSPYYNKPSQEGIYQHYKALAAVSPKPIILYNVPGRTASNILPETVKRLATDFSNIIGVKEAAGDIVQAMKLISLVPKDFLVISGDDMVALPMVLAGGHGVISVIGQGLPKGFSQMVRLGLEGKVKEAYKLHYKIAPSIDMIFAEGNPAGIKSLLSAKNSCKPVVRLPLVQVSDKLKQEIQAFVDQF
ncbi:4-hydroxy-tetrahydrodipicolinate synthase [Gillisia sp. Hel_I_86]|uniref:4-hydroxy-tetrahydrodipicolinate synthase n=1 Tax=Gillisia sp. Hel_I_86 TaxID=1249981 RepID=UPI001198F96E|nr:4-hydroxy-tetrahydrodipicolinate synthase [Gillisia sp. Hel_I_86]TVZ25365.1 4-hydroxy-tetrahydrodipicolinate synthase [Gillisia sp. Hel_I_86]